MRNRLSQRVPVIASVLTPWVGLGQIAGKRVMRTLAVSGLGIVALFFSSCGGGASKAAGAPASITPSGTGKATTGETLSDVQGSDGWKGYGELAPAYAICTTCSPKVTYSMKQTSGAAQFDIGGTVPYSDVLWNNPIIGQGSTQGLPDTDRTLVPVIKNFTYDADFFSSNLPASQVLEFDINLFLDGKSLLWGHQCRIAGGHEWDIWDNTNKDWIGTGIPCNPTNNAWNHVSLQVQRTADDQLIYQSITLNGVTSVLNRHYNPATAPSGWYGITLNFQMDGDYKQTPYTVFLDNLNFTYE